MVTLVKRLATLRSRVSPTEHETVTRANARMQLLDIRLGPGAAVLSSDVTRIHMEYARFWNDGHFGPRKFRRNCLPRLKFHNPTVAMSYNVTEDQAGPATMTVYFAQNRKDDGEMETPSSESPETAEDLPAQDDSATIKKHINMKHKTDSTILSELLEMTDGKPMVSTDEEERTLKELEERHRRIEADKARTELIKKKEQRQKELLKRAREASG